MRCKIIEFGPESVRFGETEHYGKPGRLERLGGGAPNGWLSGWFNFDEPGHQKEIFVHQMKVCPLDPWGN